MSKAPAMPMFWDAYLADTTHLTTEEHGAYLLLLAAMWRRNGSVPDSDKDNARIIGVTPAKWRGVKARLLETIPGFRVGNGGITQEKLQKTWENTQEKIEKNRANGAKGGRPKSNKNKGMEKANGYDSVNPNKSIPEPEPEPKKDRGNPPNPLEILQQVLSSDTASDFIDHRKAMKKPVTAVAANRIVAKLKDHPDPNAVVDETIANGWQGIFPERRSNGRTKQPESAVAISKRAGERWAAKERSRGMDRGTDTGASQPLLPAGQPGRDQGSGSG